MYLEPHSPVGQAVPDNNFFHHSEGENGYLVSPKNLVNFLMFIGGDS